MKKTLKKLTALFLAVLLFSVPLTAFGFENGDTVYCDSQDYSYMGELGKVTVSEADYTCYTYTPAQTGVYRFSPFRYYNTVVRPVEEDGKLGENLPVGYCDGDELNWMAPYVYLEKDQTVMVFCDYEFVTDFPLNADVEYFGCLTSVELSYPENAIVHGGEKQVIYAECETTLSDGKTVWFEKAFTLDILKSGRYEVDFRLGENAQPFAFDAFVVSEYIKSVAISPKSNPVLIKDYLGNITRIADLYVDVTMTNGTVKTLDLSVEDSVELETGVFAEVYYCLIKENFGKYEVIVYVDGLDEDASVQAKSKLAAPKEGLSELVATTEWALDFLGIEGAVLVKLLTVIALPYVWLYYMTR